MKRNRRKVKCPLCGNRKFSKFGDAYNCACCMGWFILGDNENKNREIEEFVKSLKIKYNMKEKVCVDCKNASLGIDVDGKFGGCITGFCQKNDLRIETPDTHSCDMYEEEEKENRAKMRIIKLELVRDGISVTMEDKNIGLSTECVLDIKYSDKLVIGDTMDLIFG